MWLDIGIAILVFALAGLGALVFMVIIAFLVLMMLNLGMSIGENKRKSKEKDNAENCPYFVEGENNENTLQIRYDYRTYVSWGCLVDPYIKLFCIFIYYRYILRRLNMKRKITKLEQELIANGWELESKHYEGKHSQKVFAYVYACHAFGGVWDVFYRQNHT